MKWLQVHKIVQLTWTSNQGLIMYDALQKLLGRVKRAEQIRNRGNTMKYIQSCSRFISCITHFNGNRPGERQRLKELVEDMLASMSEDEGSPTHGDTTEIQGFRICTVSERYHHHMRLLEMDLYETSDQCGDPPTPGTCSSIKGSTG